MPICTNDGHCDTLSPNYLIAVCLLLSDWRCDESCQAFVRRTVYWRRFWTWRDKLNQLKRQLQAAQQLRDQLLLAELRRTPIFAVLKRVTERRRWLEQREAADVLQVTLMMMMPVYCAFTKKLRLAPSFSPG